MRITLGQVRRRKKKKKTYSASMGQRRREFRPRTRRGQIGDPVSEALEDVAGISFARSQGIGKRLPPRQALQRVGCTISILDSLVEARIVRKRDADLVRSTLVGINDSLRLQISRRQRRDVRRFERKA